MQELTVLYDAECGFCRMIKNRLAAEPVFLPLNFVAAQSCVNAVLDIRVLFRAELVINGRIVGSSDAHNMASATFGTHWVWAGLWLAWERKSFFREPSS